RVVAFRKVRASLEVAAATAGIPSRKVKGRVSPMPQDSPGAAPSTLSVDDYRSLGEFRRAIREFLAFSEESARGHGVTAQQHQALLAIKAHDGVEPMSIGELAESLMIKNHSAVGLVS